jgi:hypothetical protein
MRARGAGEVDQEAEAEAAGAEVIQKLGVVFRREIADRLQLDDDQSKTQEVGAIALFEPTPL